MFCAIEIDIEITIEIAIEIAIDIDIVIAIEIFSNLTNIPPLQLEQSK